MRTVIGLFTLCRAAAGLSAQDTNPAAATNVKTLSLSIHSSRMVNTRFSSTWFLHERDVSRVGAISAQRWGEPRALRYSGKAAGVTVPECRSFFSRRWESKGDNQGPLATFRLQAANNFPLGAQYDSIPGTRSADDHHGIGTV